jgi:ApaG protein
MVVKETRGICVEVETRYRDAMSEPRNRHYFFSYEISITNNTDDPVQLLFRKWKITDSNGEHREVAGPGVVGLQPVIEPGTTFIYESGCNFVTDMGKMEGIFIMKNLSSGATFPVDIPVFIMNVPYRLN